jgi:hypothetical protein
MATPRNLRGPFALFFVALAGAVVLATGSACSSSSSSASCVDFVIGSADLSCSVASDCSFVGALHLCPNDPSCGAENAVNKSGEGRYQKATAAVPLTPVQCGAPSPVDCVAGACVVKK